MDIPHVTSWRRKTSYVELLQSTPQTSRNPEIFRVVSSSRVLANFGRIFAFHQQSHDEATAMGVGKTLSHGTAVCEVEMVSVPSVALALNNEEEQHKAADAVFKAARQARSIDAFVSHVWSAPRWAKCLALLYYVNTGIATLAAILAWLVAAVLVVGLMGGGDPTALGGQDLVPHLVWAPMSVFFLFFFFGHTLSFGILDESWWLDKLCIHQTRQDVQVLGLLALPEFVARSKRILILWSDTYFERLWCNAEVATFTSLHHGAENVDFMPLWLAPWVLCTLCCDIFSVWYWNHLAEWIVDIGNWLVAEHVDAVYSKFLTPFLGIGLSMGTAYLPMVILNLISFHIKMENHERMISHIENFRLQDAQCTMEEDRTVIEAHVGQLFLKECWANMAWEELPEEEKADSLEKFNSFVRGEFKQSICKRVGEVSRVPYSLAFLVFLPLNFASLANVLGCDNGECHESARVEGYSSVPQFMFTNGFSWLVGIFLIYPTTYAVMLSGLQKCRAFFPNPLVQVPASIITIASAYYYMGFLEGMAAAIIVNTVTNTTAFWVVTLAVFLTALLVWNYYLFARSSRVEHEVKESSMCCSQAPMKPSDWAREDSSSSTSDDDCCSSTSLSATGCAKML